MARRIEQLEKVQIEAAPNAVAEEATSTRPKKSRRKSSRGSLKKRCLQSKRVPSLLKEQPLHKIKKESVHEMKKVNPERLMGQSFLNQHKKRKNKRLRVPSQIWNNLKTEGQKKLKGWPWKKEKEKSFRVKVPVGLKFLVAQPTMRPERNPRWQNRRLRRKKSPVAEPPTSKDPSLDDSTDDGSTTTTLALSQHLLNDSTEENQ